MGSIGERLTSNFLAAADALERGRVVPLEPVDRLIARLREIDSETEDGRASPTVSPLADMDGIVRGLAERARA